VLLRGRGVARRARPAVAALLAAGLWSGCARGTAVSSRVDVISRLSPAAPSVGPAILTIILHDPKGDAIRGATVRLEAHMSHPGMAPIVADGREQNPGVYDLPFTFTMQGDWALLVSVQLPGGERLARRIDVANVRPALK